MGGEGAMLAMAASLKNNNNLKLKRKERIGLSGFYAGVKMQDFPSATPEMLEAIKVKTIRENKKIHIRQMVWLFVLALVFTLAYVYIIK
ncbi:hypothetical protein GCM10022291_33090 [Postechiella marina]|uniref:Uncharacterized protein n=1 Tax=Postechiella marina TaxID=943941 RepID=A0ABP8CHE2_9FLAO